MQIPQREQGQAKAEVEYQKAAQKAGVTIKMVDGVQVDEARQLVQCSRYRLGLAIGGETSSLLALDERHSYSGAERGCTTLLYRTSI